MQVGQWVNMSTNSFNDKSNMFMSRMSSQLYKFRRVLFYNDAILISLRFNGYGFGIPKRKCQPSEGFDTLYTTTVECLKFASIISLDL